MSVSNIFRENNQTNVLNTYCFTHPASASDTWTRWSNRAVRPAPARQWTCRWASRDWCTISAAAALQLRAILLRDPRRLFRLQLTRRARAGPILLPMAVHRRAVAWNLVQQKMLIEPLMALMFTMTTLRGNNRIRPRARWRPAWPSARARARMWAASASADHDWGGWISACEIQEYILMGWIALLQSQSRSHDFAECW